MLSDIPCSGVQHSSKPRADFRGLRRGAACAYNFVRGRSRLAGNKTSRQRRSAYIKWQRGKGVGAPKGVPRTGQKCYSTLPSQLRCLLTCLSTFQSSMPSCICRSKAAKAGPPVESMTATSLEPDLPRKTTKNTCAPGIASFQYFPKQRIHGRLPCKPRHGRVLCCRATD